MSRIRIKAVLVGLAISLVGSAVYGFVASLAIYYFGGWSFGRPMAELVAMRGGALLWVVGLMGQIAIASIAVYVTARMSDPGHTAGPLALGLALVAFDSVALIVRPGLTSRWLMVVAAVVTVPAVLAGAAVAARRTGITSAST